MNYLLVLDRTTAEWKRCPLPLKSKEDWKNVFFYCFPYLCCCVFFVSMFCFELLAARSVASTRREARPGRPLRLMLDQRFPNPFFTTDSDSHTPVKPHVRAESLTHTLRTSRKSNNNTLFSMFPEGAQHLILGTTALDHMGPCCCSCCNSDKRKMYYVWRLGFQ